MKKYIVYFSAQILSILSLVGYFLIGDLIMKSISTTQTFIATSRTMVAVKFSYIDPICGVLGVFVQALGLYLFCVCFGIMARYCKTHLCLRAKHISFFAYGISFVMGALFLFTNNFSMLNQGSVYAIKEIWANAVNFFVCFVACVMGFCTMYKIKNKDNHLIY